MNDKHEYIPGERMTDVSEVILDEYWGKVIQMLGEQCHEVWAKQRRGEGWIYGPFRDDIHKTNPCLVPYEDLPQEEREVDLKMVEIIIKTLIYLGHTITVDEGVD